MSEYGHTSQKPAPLLSYSHVEARKAARRKIIDEALERRQQIYTPGSEAFFRVDTFRVRRSGSHWLPINAEATPALLSTDFCLAMSAGLIPV